MIEEITSERLLLKTIPELRNPIYRQIYDEARVRCLQIALAGGDYKTIPLHSHDATRQSIFSKGWRSVSEQDIRLSKITKSANHLRNVNARIVRVEKHK